VTLFAHRPEKPKYPKYPKYVKNRQWYGREQITPPILLKEVFLFIFCESKTPQKIYKKDTRHQNINNINYAINWPLIQP
jgi:hypothetical protein